jgi:hypothetical protein
MELDTAGFGELAACAQFASAPQQQSAPALGALPLHVTHYPSASATHEQVLQDSKLFYSTLITLLNQLGLALKVRIATVRERDVDHNAL